jgi:hypothetical protein
MTRWRVHLSLTVTGLHYELTSRPIAIAAFGFVHARADTRTERLSLAMSWMMSQKTWHRPPHRLVEQQQLRRVEDAGGKRRSLLSTAG